MIKNLYVEVIQRVLNEIGDEINLKLKILFRLRKVANFNLRKEILLFQRNHINSQLSRPFFVSNLSDLNDLLRMINYEKEILNRRLINVEIKPEDECIICTDPQASGEKLTMLSCGHIYHNSCITNWLMNSNPQCPICRKYSVISL